MPCPRSPRPGSTSCRSARSPSTCARSTCRCALNDGNKSNTTWSQGVVCGQPPARQEQRMLEISRLTRRFGALTAVNDISFSAAPGEVLGFLGPNGAGKSTTMKMITGFLAPTAGTARVCGHDVETDGLAARRCVGYLPEGAPGYGEMTVRAFLEFIADVRGLAGSERPRRLDDVIARLGLGGVLVQVIETLSKGFRRRVGLAQALVHDPLVLILDETTARPDPHHK